MKLSSVARGLDVSAAASPAEDWAAARPGASSAQSVAASKDRRIRFLTLVLR
jgi:hypothetical protein